MSFCTVGVPASSKTPPCSGMPHCARVPAAEMWDTLRKVSMAGSCLSVLPTVGLLEAVCFSHRKLNRALVRFVPYNSSRNLFICFLVFAIVPAFLQYAISFACFGLGLLGNCSLPVMNTGKATVCLGFPGVSVVFFAKPNPSPESRELEVLHSLTFFLISSF